MPILDIQTHLQFYEMFVDDFDNLMREQYSARRAFHSIMEAYHLSNGYHVHYVVKHESRNSNY